MKDKQRIIGIDVLKVIAVILVLTIHFFLKTKYYSTEHSGINMHVQTIIRNFCMICVPLFMTITGYLNDEKEYNKRFFKKLLNIIIILLFYSIIEFFASGLLYNNSLDIKSLIFSILSYNACQYSWYINMFIGLYCLSPVINTSFEKFDDSSKRILFILSILIFIIPAFVNNIYSKTIYLSDWWITSYPIAYYILGKYISYKKPKFDKKILVLCLIMSQLFLFSYGIDYTVRDYNLIPIYASVSMMFLLFYDININNKLISSAFKYVSSITLDIYLASSLIDKLVYKYYFIFFKINKLSQQKTILYAPAILLVVFLLSLVYGSIRKKLINIR